MKSLAITSLSATVALLLSAALVAPAVAYPFPPGAAEFRPNPGSHPNPTAAHILGNRFYPLAAQLQNEQGSVDLKIRLTEAGAMKEAAIENSSGSARLDAAALQYAQKQYQYKAAPGEQMPELVRVTVTFNLS